MFAAVSAITIEPFVFLLLGSLYILYPAIEHEDDRYKNCLAKAAAVEWIAIKKPNWVQNRVKFVPDSTERITRKLSTAQNHFVHLKFLDQSGLYSEKILYENKRGRDQFLHICLSI